MCGNSREKSAKASLTSAAIEAADDLVKSPKWRTKGKWCLHTLTHSGSVSQAQALKMLTPIFCSARKTEPMPSKKERMMNHWSWHALMAAFGIVAWRFLEGGPSSGLAPVLSRLFLTAVGNGVLLRSMDVVSKCWFPSRLASVLKPTKEGGGGGVSEETGKVGRLGRPVA